MSRVAGVVLAAGASRRMGEPKQLLPIAGRPLLQHVLDAAGSADLTEVVLVLGHEADAIGAAVTLAPRTRVVVNGRYAEGQSTSLACGLGALGDDVEAALVLLGDQPRLTRETIDAVVHAFAAGDAPIVRPVWRAADGSRRPGHPVVLGRAVWPSVQALTGDQGARTLFESHPEWVRELAMTGEAPTDVDDRADYRRVAGG